MAKCCQGGNECNHVITIGYLKTFVGNNVQRSSDGSVISVNNNDNTYCPTYAELTGGTLIQNHSNGSTPNGDVDGIVISGNYANNQLVNQEDLSLIYTRFKSLTISATKTSGLDPCGDTSILSYVHTYTRYTRSMTSACSTVDDPFEAVTLTSTDVNDTANNEVTWKIAATAYGSISFPTYTIGKNGDGTTVTQSRYDDITASITFRGAVHTTNALRLTQAGLGGDWVFDHSDSSFNYTSLVCTPTSFTCTGGNYSVVGNYTRTDWTVYHWKDSCNTEHPEVTSSSTPTQTSLTENVAQGTAPVIDCGSLSQNYTHTENFTWHGLNASWTQTCAPCSNCDSLSLAPTAMSWTYDKSGQSVQSSATYNYSVASISIVSVACTGTNASDFNVSHSSGSKTISVYPKTQNGTMTARTATVVLTYNTASVNNCKKTIALTQGVQSCNCDSVRISPTSYTWNWDDNSSVVKNVTIESAICITSINITGGNLAHFNATLGANKVTLSPKGQNTTTSDYLGTLNINYSFGSPVSSCTKTVTLKQGNQGCGCTALTMDNSPMSWGNTETASSARTYTLEDAACVSSISVATGGTDGNKFSASLDQTNRKVTVAPIGTNMTLNAYNGTITLRYSVNGVANPCEISFNVSQAAMSCSCNDLTMDNSPMSWGNTETTSSARTYTIVNASCIGNITAYTGGTDGNKFTASVNTSTKKVTVAPIGTNTTLNAYNGTVTLQYNVNGLANPCTIPFNVSQAGTSCGCEDFSISEANMEFATCTTTAGTRTATLGVCNTITSVQSSNAWFTASVNGSTIRISASPNDSDVAKTATITVNFTANGSACTPKTFTVIQPGCNDACNNISGLPDEIDFDAS